MQLRKDKSALNAQKIWQADMELQPILHPIETEEQLTNEQLQSLLEQLPDNQKRCIHLFYYEQKCYQEIAEITGYSLKNVKSYLQNGKRNLQIRLKGKAG
jgi:RNA polymerase sigma-70 factor (ECF subfamily)